jgi:aspartyl/glutamyl-tRNA(Asn/Gln) amidotransferase C subunit
MLDGILREDMPKESLTNKDALKNSKNNKDNYIKGPKIL